MIQVFQYPVKGGLGVLLKRRPVPKFMERLVRENAFFGVPTADRMVFRDKQGNIVENLSSLFSGFVLCKVVQDVSL